MILNQIATERQRLLISEAVGNGGVYFLAQRGDLGGWSGTG